jgi:curved DNA-binding protein CbpA
MPDPYNTLGVPADADDEAIRRRYLELTREFTPEHHPERFASVRTAYEKVKDLDSRVRYRLFEAAKDDTIESIIEEEACRTPRQRTGLRAILTAVLPPL